MLEWCGSARSGTPPIGFFVLIAAAAPLEIRLCLLELLGRVIEADFKIRKPRGRVYHPNFAGLELSTDRREFCRCIRLSQRF